MKILLAVAIISLTMSSAGAPPSEAPTGFGNQSNGLVDQATHQAD